MADTRRSVAVPRVCLRCRSDDHVFRACPLNGRKVGDALPSGPPAGDATSPSEKADGSGKKTKGGSKRDSKGGRLNGRPSEEGRVCGFCYNCGGNHKLTNCPTPREEGGSLPFASCFVCGGKGHIASHCASNPNGIYPRGGACRFCGSKFHLKKDCPGRKKVAEAVRRNFAEGGDEDADAMWAVAKDGGEAKVEGRKRPSASAGAQREKKLRRTS